MTDDATHDTRHGTHDPDGARTGDTAMGGAAEPRPATAALATLAAAQLAVARTASSGRSAHTLYGGRGHRLRQTLIALAAGQQLAEHDSPGEATLQVLRGHVRLTTPSGPWEGQDDDFTVIPPQRHGLEALADSVVLLTVVTGG